MVDIFVPPTPLNLMWCIMLHLNALPVPCKLREYISSCEKTWSSWLWLCLSQRAQKAGGKIHVVNVRQYVSYSTTKVWKRMPNVWLLCMDVMILESFVVVFLVNSAIYWITLQPQISGVTEGGVRISSDRRPPWDLGPLAKSVAWLRVVSGFQVTEPPPEI